MMDRPSSSTNPLFIEQDDDMNNYVTKLHLFGTQRALHEEQLAMSDRIDNLATDLRISEQRTRDYFDNKLDEHKHENDARMDEFVPCWSTALLPQTEPLESTLRRHHLRLKYPDFEYSSSCRASRSSSQPQSSTRHRLSRASTSSKPSYILASTRTATSTPTRIRGASAPTTRCTRCRGTTPRTKTP